MWVTCMSVKGTDWHLVTVCNALDIAFGVEIGQAFLGTLFLFYKRPVYKRHEAEICRNFKNKIRECPGWDSLLEIF